VWDVDVTSESVRTVRKIEALIEVSLLIVFFCSIVVHSPVLLKSVLNNLKNIDEYVEIDDGGLLSVCIFTCRVLLNSNPSFPFHVRLSLVKRK